nr:unnamed protein product [Callosobruchus chinensis]
MKDQFLPRSSHTNLPDTDDEISVTPISTPGEANGQNEDEVEDIRKKWKTNQKVSRRPTSVLLLHCVQEVNHVPF